jgi:hypothetical protein
LTLFPGRAVVELQKDAIQNVRPHVYAYDASRQCCVWPLRIEASAGSRFLENGIHPARAVWNAQAVLTHAAAYWLGDDGSLLFSTSDRSDPRSNTHTYSFVAPTTPRPTAWFAVAALLALGLAGSRLSIATKPLATSPALGAWASFYGSHRRLITSLGLVAAAIAASALVLARWWSGQSSHLGFVGFMPVSDALGYYRCAVLANEPDLNTLAAMPPEWCARRAVYPLALQTLLAMSGWNAGIALLVQASLIGVAIVLLTAAVWRTAGGTAALVVIGVCTIFAYDWAIGNFMTESLGLTAGVTAAALLATHAVRRDPWVLCTGIALLSFALAARAGALFALPLVALWGYMTLNGERGLDFRSAMLVLCAAAVGPLMQAAGALHLGAPLGNSGGNFAASLYGLSTGARDWQQAYRDFADLRRVVPETELFRLIQQKAIANILAQPAVFLNALVANGKDFVVEPFSFLRPEVNTTATALLLVGTGRCIRKWRQPEMSLPLVVFAGELLAAPLIMDSAGHRSFAATFWVRPLLAGIGLQALFDLAQAWAKRRPRDWAHVFAMTGGRPWHMLAFSASLIALPLVPLTSLLHGQMLGAVDERPRCGPKEFGIATRLGAVSMAIGIDLRQETPVNGPLRVLPGQIESDPVATNAWWASRLGDLRPDTWMAYAFDLQPQGRGRLFSLIWEGTLPKSSSGLYALCVGAEEKGRRLGDLPFHRVTRVTALD